MTPKIAAMLLIMYSRRPEIPVVIAAAAMIFGGSVHARRVAETMRAKITDLSSVSGLTANLGTSLLVVGASRIGLPVSTTHISVGAIGGTGLLTGGSNRALLSKIFASWCIVLPATALTSGPLYLTLSL